MGYFSVSYRSVHCYLLDSAAGLLAFDCGWPGSLREYRDALKAEGRRIDEIAHLVVSHFHIDHAGLAGEFLERGVAFSVFPNQLGSIGDMEDLIMRKGYPYRAIDREKLSVVGLEASREWLSSLGIRGEAVQADGHGEGHVCLLLDDGTVFSGDLAPETAIGEYDEKTRSNWDRLRAMGARFALPAHGPAFPLT